MTSPQFFGELALLHDQPRSGTLVVSEDAELLTLTRPQFLALMKGAPTLEQQIRRHFFSS